MEGDARQIASVADDSANSRSFCVLWRFSSEVVGATGFEPATPCAQGRCATRLRYAPTRLIIPRPHGFLPAKDATRLRRSRGTVHSPESPGGHTGFGVRPCNRSGPQSIQSAMKTFVSPFTFA